MAKRRSGEGSWGTKTIKGVTYKYYRDVDRHYYYGKTIKEIKEKIKKAEESQGLLLSADDKEIQKKGFAEYVMDWLLNIKIVTLKRNTTDGYEHCLKGQLVNFKYSNIRNKQVGTLTTKDLQKYYKTLADHYARSTIQKNYAIIAQCIKYGNKKNHFAEHIDLDEIYIPNEDLVAHQKKEIHFLKEEDIPLFCKEAKKSIYGNNAYMLMFIIFTGLRLSEAIELKWENIDYEKKCFTVMANAAVVKDRKTNKRVTSSSSTKTFSGNRVIPLNKNALSILEHESNLNPNHSLNDYIFITKNGTKVTSRQNVNHSLTRIMSRAGCSIPDCTVHELRHTFGSLLLKKGVDIKIVSELLGHKDIKITYNVYIHILQEQRVDSMNALDSIEI